MVVSGQFHAAVALAAEKEMKDVRLRGASDRSVVGSDESNLCVHRESNPHSVVVMSAT